MLLIRNFSKYFLSFCQSRKKNQVIFLEWKFRVRSSQPKLIGQSCKYFPFLILSESDFLFGRAKTLSLSKMVNFNFERKKAVLKETPFRLNLNLSFRWKFETNACFSVFGTLSGYPNFRDKNVYQSGCPKSHMNLKLRG
mgnify:CR=1 FL=1